MTRLRPPTGLRLCTLDRAAVLTLAAGSSAIHVDEAAGEALWYTWSNGAGTITIDGERGRCRVRVPDGVRVDSPVPVSERILRYCYQRGNSALGDIEFDIVLVDERTIAAIAGNSWAVVDLVRHVEPPQVRSRAFVASAKTEGDALAASVASAWVRPTTYRPERPAPVAWVQVGDDRVGVHVDWSDHGCGPATYWVGADRIDEGGTRDAVTVGVDIQALGVYLDIVPLEGDDITVRVVETVTRGEHARIVEVLGDSWLLALPAMEPALDRWQHVVHELLMPFDATRGTSAWSAVVAGVDVVVTLHHGTPDICRVSSVVAEGVVENVELLRELMTLNAASTGERYWVEGTRVVMAVDVRCTHLDDLPMAVDGLAAAHHRVTPLLDILARG
jgi:hypothetical protein